MLEYFIKVGDQAEKNIKTEYGVHVSASEGLVGKPPFKDGRSYSWDYLNGEWTDLGSRRYKSREIRMVCWIAASDYGFLAAEGRCVRQMNTFLGKFDTDGLVRLRIRFNGSEDVRNNLYYLVYLKSSSYRYKWRKGQQVIEFELRLVEPSPEKSVYLRTYEAGTVTADFSSSSEFDIDWGDGSVSYDLVGSRQTVSHTYRAGSYVIIVSGIEKDIDIRIPSGTMNVGVTTDDTL